MLERNSIDREMTPDSINNDPQNIPETFPASRKAHHPQQRKKIIVNRSNGATHRHMNQPKLVKTRMNQTRKPNNLGVINPELTTGQSSGVSSSSTSSSTLSSPIFNSESTEPQTNNYHKNPKQRSLKSQPRESQQTNRIPSNRSLRTQNSRVINEQIVQKVNTPNHTNSKSHSTRLNSLLYNPNNNHKNNENVYHSNLNTNNFKVIIYLF